jgi:MFS family permease
MNASSNAMSEGDRLARRNAFVLACGSALGGANASVVIATGSIVGQGLSPSPALVTLPVSTFVLGTALLAMPASNLMRVVGRRNGFMLGSIFGILAGLFGMAAVWFASFATFCVATALAGAYQSFIVLYRYAAADSATPAFRPKAVSWVMVGGVAAAFVGPQLTIWTKDLFPPIVFLGTYLGQALIAAIAMGVVAQFRDSPVSAAEAGGIARPLREILANNRLRVAILCGMTAQALMNMVMTASPIAMIGCGHSITQSTLGIQWHVLSMFAPGFFTGSIIARFGRGPVIAVGLVILAASALVNISGITLAHFWGGLILLGLGWNFAFTGATALIIDCHTPAERGKVQGFADFSIFGATTIASLMAGYLYHAIGWSAVNWMVLPVVGLAALALFATGLAAERPKTAA